jgi:hypothetical protein
MDEQSNGGTGRSPVAWVILLIVTAAMPVILAVLAAIWDQI